MRIVISGLDSLQARLARMGTSMKGEMLKATTEAVLYVQSQMPPYPPPPPESTYRRTGTLGRSVTSMAGAAPGALGSVKSIGGGVVGTIGTKIVYGPYVIDENRQAKVHQGRWWTLQEVFRKSQKGIMDVYRRMVARWKGG